jgi:GrpB-like predicted nucleotidyltransferase (UPF0157 family)
MPEPEYLVARERGSRVFLSEPDPSWVVDYAVEQELISEALGPVLVTIDHAGSTSVPDLAAKPIVDVVLTVEDPTDEAAYVQPLQSAGYVFHHREPHWHEHRLFKKGMPHFAPDRPPGPRVNLHVFPHLCDEVRRMLVFRDWLRSNPVDRDRYEQVKRRLAAQEWEVVQDYADAKSDVVAEIMERALQASNGDGSPAPTRTTSG